MGSRLSRRVGLVWIVVVVALACVSAAGAAWLMWPREALRKRVANETIDFPLTPPSTDPWNAVDAFPKLRFAEPVLATTAPGDEEHLYVLERRGTIQVIRNDPDADAKSLLLDISPRVISTPDGDNGALGLAFHPHFSDSASPHRGEFFVLYTAIDGKTRYNRLSRFALAAGKTQAEAASETVLINQLDENEWHDGGPLLFGADGFLYLGLGDEGYADDYYENGQQVRKDLFSGVLRIDVDCQGGDVSHAPPRQPETAATAHYFIPNDNPFVGLSGALEEFYAIGLRNPYRMAFDPLTGDLWAGDVGQNLREEICLVAKGSNHGWSYSEGSLPFDRSYLKGKKPLEFFGKETPPVFEYPHVNGNNCVILGYVYRGKQFPQLVGKLIYGDNVSGRVWALEYDRTLGKVVSNQELLDLPHSSKSGLSSFGEDQSGELLMCILGSHGGEDGKLLRLVKSAQGEGAQPLPRLLSQTGIFADLSTLKPNPGVISYDVNSPLWSDGTRKQRWLMVPGNGNDPDAANDRVGFTVHGSWNFPSGTVFIKHFELPVDEERPEVVKRLETRVLVRDAAHGVYGCTYKWNDEGTDAELLAGAVKEDVRIRQIGGRERTQTWSYPGRNDCLVCHTQNAGYVLGVTTCQLNGDMTYPETGRTANQLRALERVGLFRRSLDQDVAQLPRLIGVDDTSASLELRVRSYLESNCASCHRPGGMRAGFDARFENPRVLEQLVNGAVQKDWGVAGAKLVVPGEAMRSMLLLRLIDGAHRMPPLGVSQTDMPAVQAVCQWIDSLPRPETPATEQKDGH